MLLPLEAILFQTPHIPSSLDPEAGLDSFEKYLWLPTNTLLVQIELLC